MKRRYNIQAEVQAFNQWLGPLVPLSANEKLWIPHQLIGFGSQHRHECFVQEAWYFPRGDTVCLWIKTKYGIHSTHCQILPYYWSKLLKRAGIPRIPQNKQER